MDISRYLVVRIVAISIAILAVATALAVWRAQFDVEREEIGASQLVRLFEGLNALENGPRADLDASIRSLQRINAAGDLRHVQLDLRDAEGRALIVPKAGIEPGVLQRVFARVAPGLRQRRAASFAPWVLRRDDGAVYTATLSMNPVSEQQEAFDNLLGMLFVLVGYGGAMLLAVYLTLKRALRPLQTIVAAIARYGRSQFEYRLQPLPFREMDTIGRALNTLAGELDATQRERRALSLKLVSSQEDERARIARELHDQFGQNLTAIRADATWLLRKTAARPDEHAVLQGLAAQCEQLHGGVRELLSRLRAPLAQAGGDDVPLPAMLEELLHGWRARPQNATRFALHHALGDEPVPSDVTLAIYRLTQEALTNAVRHARAESVGVSLVRGADGALLWAVEDDGVGADSLSALMQRGNGLAGMRERVWALGGDFDVGAARAGAARPGLRVAARFVWRARSRAAG